ncbi:MAG: hypothetical protein M1820_001224 [Bogoriella megaspora]|nr:MAG: hypothetical protein M1820_001224 [Bogoriella megaspora]
MAAENAERSGWISYLETRPLRSRGQSKDVAPQQALQPIEQYMEFDHLGPVNDPLVDRNIDLLIEDAKRFYRGFPDEVNGVIAPTAELDQIVTEEMFVRGALLAQRRQNLSDPPLIQSSNGSKSSPEESGSGQEMERPQLNMVEYRSLQKEEASHFKDQTKTLNVILLTCCVGGIVQGWSQAGMAGANLSWPCELPGNIGNKDSGSCRPQRLWVFNGVNAATYFSGCFSVWLSDLLNDKFYGRRGALMIAATFTFCGSIWSGYAYTWRQLLGARLILGIGYGAKVSVVTIFESEVAPSKRRGRVLVSWQTFTALAWACSESPRWLIKKERYKDAFIVLRDLRGTDLQAARDLYFIYAQLRVEMRILAGKKGHPLEKWENYLYYQLELLKSTYTTRLKQLLSGNSLECRWIQPDQEPVD